MRKILIPLLFTPILWAQNIPDMTQKTFEEIDRLFEMQMRQMEQIQKQMEAMFKAFEHTNTNISLPAITNSGGIISSGLQDKKDYYEIVLNNAVADNAKINVEAKDGILTISVNAQKEIEQNTTNGIVKSFSTTSFMQSFTLPTDANSEDITYEVKDGKIIVKIPKKS